MILIKTRINEIVKDIIKNDSNLCKREIKCSYVDDSSRMPHYNRYIQVRTAFSNLQTIHYEFILGKWELHIEKPIIDDGYNYFRIMEYLKNETRKKDCIQWEIYDDVYIARYNVEIASENDIKLGLEFLYNTFDSLLENCNKIFKKVDLSSRYELVSELKDIDGNDEVMLRMMKLKDLFDLKLTIPDYQRIYCWKDNDIEKLWNTFLEIHNGSDYHLGTIILHKNNENNYDIIDGQQRLVTITIILRALGYSGNMPLLLQRFVSNEACKNISNAKYVVKNIISCNKDRYENVKNNILEHLRFSILILQSENLDLAYTFFSTQNSRGVRLSDFDILKAHHLRFLVTNDIQSEHLARRWNSISQEYESTNELIIEKSLGLYLFRIRKWMRKHSCDWFESNRPIKEEYSAAPIILGIPPFCERFYFYEKIQGGSHFFAFSEHFVELYKQFIRTPQVYLLRKYLLAESHWKYESAIETVLFAYFTKFGKQYFSEAIYCIIGVIAQHRYTKRAIQYKINEYVNDSELIMMIDQATSPSFFLAETLSLIKISGRDLDKNDIKRRFYHLICKFFKSLNDVELINNEEDLRMARFTDSFIESRKNEEYE